MFMLSTSSAAVFARPAERARLSRRASRRASATVPQALFGFGKKKEEKKQEEEEAVEAWLTPQFTPVKRGSIYELRVYGAYTIARTPYDKRPEGLSRLMDYFEGGNDAKAPIPGTQPLTMRYQPTPQGLAKTMELFVPAPGTKNGGPAIGPPPACLVDGVELTAGGAEAVAVALVTGNVTPEIAADVRKKLVDAITADGLKVHPEDADGGFRIAQFGPMYTLTPRKNELMVRVKL